MLALLGPVEAKLSVLISGSFVHREEFHCSKIVKICISLVGLFPRWTFLTGLTPKIPAVGRWKYIDKLILTCCTPTSAVWDIILYWLQYWLFFVVNLLSTRITALFCYLDKWHLNDFCIYNYKKNWKHFTCLLFVLAFCNFCFWTLGQRRINTARNTLTL